MIRMLAQPAIRYAASRASVVGARVSPVTTQLATAAGGRRSTQFRDPATPLALPSTALQVRAVSNSKKAKKAKKAGKKSDKGRVARSRHGPASARRETAADPTAPSAKPLREDLDMSELRIDSLLNELVDGGEGMSNRAKFRALPVDDRIMRIIKEVRPEPRPRTLDPRLARTRIRRRPGLVG